MYPVAHSQGRAEPQAKKADNNVLAMSREFMTSEVLTGGPNR